MEIFEIPLAADGVDALAHEVGHMAESGVENVDNRLASVLDKALLTAFLEAFFKAFFKAFFEGEFFEEGYVGHGCVW